MVTDELTHLVVFVFVTDFHGCSNLCDEKCHQTKLTRLNWFNSGLYVAVKNKVPRFNFNKSSWQSPINCEGET